MKAIDLDKLYRIAGKKVFELENELHAFSGLLLKNFDLKYFFGDVSVPPENKKKLFSRLFPKASKLFKNLVNLLIKEGLTRKMTSLSDGFTRMVSQRKNVDFVDVISALPLTKDELSNIKSSIGENVRMRAFVDPSIIGGARIKWSDGRFLDVSVSGFLKQLKEEMLV